MGNMAERFKNKYRISSARLQSWDYGWKGAYFISICTCAREHYFGEIMDGKMQLSKIGIITQGEWLKTKDMRPDMNLEFGKFVVMPNHFHAIIGIGENQYNRGHRRDAMHCVSTNQFGPQRKNLASIIRGFKASVTKQARQILTDFSWQPRFHDHIIRNDESFNQITEYIQTNPKNWENDTFHPDRDKLSRIGGGDVIVDGGDVIVDGGDVIVDGGDVIVDGRDAMHCVSTTENQPNAMKG